MHEQQIESATLTPAASHTARTAAGIFDTASLNTSRPLITG
jgi:hypothetical protein